MGELDITLHELKELRQDKDEEIDHKEEQIRQLKQRMNEMAMEFSEMLTQSLELMKQHINDKLPDNRAEASEDASKEFENLLHDYARKAQEVVTVSSRAPVAALPDRGERASE